jgi:hypothetical protein
MQAMAEAEEEEVHERRLYAERLAQVLSLLALLVQTRKY